MYKIIRIARIIRGRVLLKETRQMNYIMENCDLQIFEQLRVTYRHENKPSKLTTCSPLHIYPKSPRK